MFFRTGLVSVYTHTGGVKGLVSSERPRGAQDLDLERYLPGPQRPPLVQAVDEPGRQADVVPHHGPVVGEPVDAAHTPAQVSVDHRRQLAVSELRGQGTR